METYNNAFDPQEDFMLWELHEIRHALHQELSQKTIEEINADALKKYQHWQEDLFGCFGNFEDSFPKQPKTYFCEERKHACQPPQKSGS